MINLPYSFHHDVNQSTSVLRGGISFFSSKLLKSRQIDPFCLLTFFLLTNTTLTAMALICQPGFLVITFWRVLSLEKLIGSFLNQQLSNLNFYMLVYPKKVLLNRFTLYVITQYNFIARVYVNGNSYGLRSAKVCPSPSSHFSHIGLAIVNRQ